MGRIVLFMRAGALRERLRAALVARGADVLATTDADDVGRWLARGAVRGVVASLDPSPRRSGLPMLARAQDLAPAARRVLVVDGPSPIAESAYAIGLCERLLHETAPSSRAEPLADWLLGGGVQPRDRARQSEL